MQQYEDVQYIINSAAVDLGLKPATDVLSASNDAFIQLRYLLDSAGQSLVTMNHWPELEAEHTFTTEAGKSAYDLPADFSHMIPQTHWDRTNDLPMQGPLTAQTWQYLKGRELVSSSIYASFRQKNGKVHIFPDDPVLVGIEIAFEYIRRTWLQDIEEETTRHSKVAKNSDIVLFPPILIKEFLKVKFLEAKGFDSTKARDEFALQFEAASGQQGGGAPILSAGGGRQFPYLDIFKNVSDTNYGAS